MSMTAKRVAIIGAGPSGLAALRAFGAARKAGEKVPELVCFERQATLGGMWNYTWRTGLDEYGEPVHASMYRFLWSNGPKEGLEFSDYSFEEHFGRPIPSYPPREVLLDYIVGRIKRDNLEGDMRFSTSVREVQWDAEADNFLVTVEDLTCAHVYSERFDYVIVASGHFSTPNVPAFPGFDLFPGRVLHAHDFRDANEFAGKDVLLVGSSYSAEDIGTQCYKYGAKSITFSYRSQPLGFNWPEGFEEHPLLLKVDGDVAHFQDGVTKKVDAIVLCTGYKHYFPFLPDYLRLKTHNCLYPASLYKGVCWIDNPKLLYLGMQDQYYTFNMFDAQAWFARDVIMERLDLPGRADMLADSKVWVARDQALENASQEIDFQTDYVRDLMTYTDYPPFDLDKVAALFKEWKHDKEEGIMTFRDRSYRSVLTGTMAPPHHTLWMEAMDDSLEAFLAPVEQPRVRVSG